jgi:hypothetical protein
MLVIYNFIILRSRSVPYKQEKEITIELSLSDEKFMRQFDTCNTAHVSASKNLFWCNFVHYKKCIENISPRIWWEKRPIAAMSHRRQKSAICEMSSALLLRNKIILKLHIAVLVFYAFENNNFLDSFKQNINFFHCAVLLWNNK